MLRASAALAVFVLIAASADGWAQALATEPVALADGRVVLGGEVTATIANTDPGFFNYTDYEFSALRNVRLALGAEVRASKHVQLLAEVRLDHGDIFQPFAFYARLRPWPARRLDVQIGRVPPTFGAFGRTSYGHGNLLVGTPLAYQYLTSLRPDALPATTADLTRMRGRGWLSSFPLGNRTPAAGVPLVNIAHWDTGVQVHGVNGSVEWTGAVTLGSLSSPRVSDDNGSRQASGRIVVRPDPAISVGFSASRGGFLSRTLEGALSPGQRLSDGVQQALGVDAEWSRGRALARMEFLRMRWTLPVALTSMVDERLGATTLLGEARYRLWPGVHVAGRIERMGFSDLPTATGLETWEAPVRRLELGAGYTPMRQVMVKAAWQRNTRDGGRVRRDSLMAWQLVYWF